MQTTKYIYIIYLFWHHDFKMNADGIVEFHNLDFGHTAPGSRLHLCEASLQLLMRCSIIMFSDSGTDSWLLP